MYSDNFFFEVFCATTGQCGNTEGTGNSKRLLFQLACGSAVRVRC